MGEKWEEALDLDDSDLPSFSLKPTLLPCSNSTPPLTTPQPPHPVSPSPARPIPGPAGTLQSSFRNHMISDHPAHRQFADDCGRNSDSLDHDFNGNAWITALDFLGIELGSPLPHPIKRIQSMERVPRIIAIIKSCTPNGLGDLMVTLKDPTGVVVACIHHKVLAENVYARDISVGSVVILKQVVAFSPTRSSCYLNITSNNVVKEATPHRVTSCMWVGRLA